MSVDPLFLAAGFSILLNVSGLLLSTWLVYQAWGDAFALRILQVNGHRKAVAGHSLLSEGVRCGAQALLLLHQAPIFFVAPERYVTFLNDLWPLAALSTGVHVLLSIFLAWNSVKGLQLRWIVRSGIITEPDPDDLDPPLN